MRKVAILVHGTIPHPSNLTCMYEFTVEASHVRQEAGSFAILTWSGQGCGGAYFGKTEGLVGPRPRFELCAGWLTLFPTEGWTQSLPLFSFSGFEQIFEQPDARRQMRDLKSYEVYIGEALQNALRIGDTFAFSRNVAGDFSYHLARDCGPILRAGSASRVDEGGPVAIWQEFERHPNPNVGELRKRFPTTRVAEWIDVRKPYITARVNEQVFHLVDGEDAQDDPYYLFLARSTQKGRGIGIILPQAVCSAGHLAELRKELIRDAAHQLIAPKTKIL
jgi:hypothetical protein